MLKITLKEKIKKMIEKEDQIRKNYRDLASFETKEERVNRIASIYRISYILVGFMLIVAIVTGISYFFILPPDPPLEASARVNLVFSARSRLLLVSIALEGSFFWGIILYATNTRIKTYKLLKQRYFENTGKHTKISIYNYVLGSFPY